MKTEEQKKKHAEYMRGYTRKHKERINARRRKRKLERIAAGEDVNEVNRRNNRKYYERNKDQIKARAKARNWNYDPVQGKIKREKHRDKHPARSIFRSRKSRALQSGLIFELTEEWYYDQ